VLASTLFYSLNRGDSLTEQVYEDSLCNGLRDHEDMFRSSV
jgi:hypothetical protein